MAQAILLISLSACGGEAPAEETMAEEAPAAASQSVALTTEQIDLAGIELGRPEKRLISDRIDCMGRVEVPPQSLYSVYTPVKGFVGKVDLLPGNYVRRGQLLTTVSHPDLVRLQREFLETAQRLLFLERDYQRKDTLAAANAASRRALEEARAEYEVARAHYRGLRAELRMIGFAVDQLEEGGEIREGIPLYAPVSGFISQVNVNPGKLAQPEELLFEIVDDTHTHLELQVFAKDLFHLQKGQRIECVVPGTAREFMGEVHLIGHMIDQETKTTMVHGHFDNEPTGLTPGAYVQARIHTDEEEVWTLPLEALIRQGEESFVFVRRGEGFVRVPVQLGRENGDFAEVVDLDLAEGEQLVVKGAYYLNGMMDEE